MLSKKSLGYIKTAEAVDKNKQQPQLQSLQAELRNVEYSNNSKNNGIEELKRKIDTLTRYQKPYISKMLNNLLLENPINAVSLIQIGTKSQGANKILLITTSHEQK
jgi:hypothetical protein